MINHDSTTKTNTTTHPPRQLTPLHPTSSSQTHTRSPNHPPFQPSSALPLAPARLGSLRPSRMPSPPQSSDLANLPPTPPATLADPFLAQIHSRNIPITEQDRQEGYDVDLVNAQPRGPSHAAPASGAGGAGPGGLERVASRERHSLGGAPIAAGGVGGVGGMGAGGGTGYGEYSDDEGKRESTTAGASYGGITSTDPFLLEGAEGRHAELNKKQRTKRWILRPLPLAVIIAFICALALAIGLGVGLTKRSSNNRAAGVAAQTSGRHTTATAAASGTVIPSSAYPTTTTKARTATVIPSTAVANGPIATAITTTALTATTSTITASDTTATTTKTLASPITSTVYASTGDLPVPADSETTRDGTIYSSVTGVHKRANALPTAPPTEPTAFVKARLR